LLDKVLIPFLKNMKNFYTAFIDVVRNHLSELNNVTWPTRKQAIHSMVTVLITILIAGTLLVFIDKILNSIILFLNN